MSKTRLTSRLANKQKQEITKQTLVFILLSIVIGLVFIFVILPNGVRLFFEIFDKQTDISQSEMIPPQPPTIASPPSHTNLNNISLVGYAESNSKIKLEVNNQVQKTLEVDESANFEILVNLAKGENIIRVYSVDEFDNESRPLELTIVFDQTQPEIIVEQPEDGAEFRLKEEEVVQVRGETKPRSKVYINDRLSYAGNDGQFSARVQLTRGENLIKIKVIDQAGNETEKEIKVRYQF